MTHSIVVTNLHCTMASDASTRSGRLGTIAFDCGAFHLSNLQLRKSASGRIYLSYRYAQVQPASDDARIRLEIAVISALRIKPEELSA